MRKRKCILSLVLVLVMLFSLNIPVDAFAYTPWQENQGDFHIVNGILLTYQGPDVRSIVTPNGVRDIADGAFYSSSNVRSITFPASVTRIGEWAFKHSYIEEVNFGGTKEQWDAVNIVPGSTNWKLRDESTAIHYGIPY